MTALELINELQELVDQHGDCIVTMDLSRPVAEVYPVSQNEPDPGSIVEFSLMDR